VEAAKIREGDSVVRKSYGSDLIFQVMCVDCDGPGEPRARLKGLNVRLVADAPVSDLELADERAVIELRRETMRQSAELVRAARMRMQQEEQARSKKERRRSVFGLARALGAAATADDRFSLPGKVLHIDGDADYLRDCMRYYKDLGVPAVGKHIKPEHQADAVENLLAEVSPDVLVLTGHDALKRKGSDRAMMSSYWNSEHYVNAVRRARRYENDLDGLVIVAGACQSFYEALIEAGANFASAPERVLIHCMDPVLIAERIVNTPVDEMVLADQAVDGTITKRPGMGGVQTRGKMRVSIPRTALGVNGAGRAR
jgi:spore coat assembly protein